MNEAYELLDPKRVPLDVRQATAKMRDFVEADLSLPYCPLRFYRQRSDVREAYLANLRAVADGRPTPYLIRKSAVSTPTAGFLDLQHPEEPAVLVSADLAASEAENTVAHELCHLRQHLDDPMVPHMTEPARAKLEDQARVYARSAVVRLRARAQERADQAEADAEAEKTTTAEQQAAWASFYSRSYGLRW